MKQDFENSQWCALSLHIGAGREAPSGDMTLSLEYQPTLDLVWENTRDDEMRVHCASSAWCEWLSTDFPVDRFDACPPDLYPLLTRLGFERADAFLQQMQFSPGELKRKNSVAGWQVVLTLHREEQRLPIVLTECCWARLQQLTADWLPWDNTSESLPITLPLSIGWSYLSGDRVFTLKAGDGIVLQSAANIHVGEMWMEIDEKRITMTFNDAVLKVNAVEPEYSHAGNGVQAAFGSIPFKVVAELGEVTLTAAQLTTLAPGQILDGKTALSGGIRLSVNGFCIGYGSLIELQNQWVVRVDALVNTQLRQPEVVRTDKVQEESGDGMVG